jgi:hypothetical protein
MKQTSVVLRVVVFAVGLLASATALDSNTGKRLNLVGWIGDQRCSAKLAKASTVNESDIKCVKACIDRGEKVVFIDERDKAVIAIHNPEAVKGHEGHHVAVIGR